MRWEKRFLDLGLSILIMPFLLPIVLVISFVLWFEFGADLVYKQVRVGLHAKPFKLYKFKTIRAHNPIFISAFCSFLRRSKLDEVLQILNVIKGDMSFVGPRPERVEIHAEICTLFPDFRKRTEVLPGITGLAQIRNPHANYKEYRQKWADDLEYIQARTILLDLKIIIQTIWAIVKPAPKASPD